MRKNILLLASMALAVLLVSGASLAQPAPGEVPDASCPTNSGPSNLEAFFRSSAIEAQTFTAEYTGLLTSAQVEVGDLQNASTGIVMEIRTVDSSGRPTGVVLASTTIPASDVPSGQFGIVTGHFSPGAPVEAGQQFAIALHTSTEVQGNGLSWQGSTSNPCPGVLYHTHESHPGVFVAPSPNWDLFFSTFVTPSDTTPPKVISTVPKANTDEVAPTANIRATFSEDMREASVKNAFKLFRKGSTNQIDAAVTYDAATDTATLNPTNNLRREATYKAVVSTWAKDVAGNRLDQNPSLDGLQKKVWFFEIDD
jgi:hypothetical protein